MSTNLGTTDYVLIGCLGGVTLGLIVFVILLVKCKPKQREPKLPQDHWNQSDLKPSHELLPPQPNEPWPYRFIPRDNNALVLPVRGDPTDFQPLPSRELPRMIVDEYRDEPQDDDWVRVRRNTKKQQRNDDDDNNMDDQGWNDIYNSNLRQRTLTYAPQPMSNFIMPQPLLMPQSMILGPIVIQPPPQPAAQPVSPPAAPAPSTSWGPQNAVFQANRSQSTTKEYEIQEQRANIANMNDNL